MKTVISRSGIKLAAVCCLFFGTASAYAGNVSMGISFGWPFYIPEPIVYASPPVVYVSPLVTHVSHPTYFGHRPRGYIYAKGHARPGNYRVSRYQHQRVQHQQRPPQRSDHRR